MKRWSKITVSLLTAIALTLPAYALAAEHESHTNSQSSHHHKCPYHKMKNAENIGIHKEMYMTMLAEKFTPESVKDWQEVMAKRNKLKSEMRKFWEEKIKSKQYHKGSAKSEDKEKNHHHHMKNEKSGKIDSKMEKRMVLHNEFALAVKSRDTAMIKAVLPKLLEQYKNDNKILEDHLAKMKKAMDEL